MLIERVLFAQSPEVLSVQRDQVRRSFAHMADMEVSFAGRPEDISLGMYFDAVIAPTLPWLPDLLHRLSHYSWIHFLSAGVDKIWDMDFEKRGILLTKSSGVHCAPMSEYAIGAMLFFAKQFGRFWQQSQAGEWSRVWLDELTGRTVLVLGLGHVGQAVAVKAKTFDMRVMGTLRRVRPVPGVDRVVSMDGAAEYLCEADYLIVCLPLTELTHGFVDDALFKRIKRGGVLIDISRGGVVKGDAVIRALNAGTLSGAALDVFESQPLPADSPLWKRQDVLITPHVSGTTPHYLERALQIFFQNAECLRGGKGAITPVDLNARY
jgi:phosphoglycerate dehydrogenase-like enzyme